MSIEMNPNRPSNMNPSMNPNRNLKKSIGLFGGTFDPIHLGHLRMALEIQENLLLDEIRFIPCHHPPLKKETVASPEHRLNMLRLALLNTPFIVDDLELQREGPSYTVDTLQIFREKFREASLCLMMGVDAFLNLPAWHQSEKLIQLSNIVVMYRGGYKAPSGLSSGPMKEFLTQHALNEKEDIRSFSAGRLATPKTTELNISGTEIRRLIQEGRNPRFLIPDTVWSYIQENKLYEAIHEP